jgi:hypothetical protein
VNRITARTLFGAAVTLYLLWVAALVCLIVVSAFRPSGRQRQTPADRNTACAYPEHPRRGLQPVNRSCLLLVALAGAPLVGSRS